MFFGNTISNQEIFPVTSRLKQEERVLTESEVQGMLKKGAIHQMQTTQGKFLSNIFLVLKEDWENQLVVNLKYLKSLIPYQRFKMEGIHLIKESQQPVLGKTSQYHSQTIKLASATGKNKNYLIEIW